MGRPERALDPSDGPVAAFAAGLRELRTQAGNPPYLKMARATKRSRTALSEAAGGDHLATWETVHAYVTACGGDVTTWRRRWQQVRDQLDGCAPSVVDPASATDLDDGDAPAADTAGDTAVLIAASLPPPQPDRDAAAPGNADDVSAQPTNDLLEATQPRPRRLPFRRPRVVAGAAVGLVAVGVGVGVAVDQFRGQPGGRPAVIITAQNKYASGPELLAEDKSPLYLSTSPITGCRSRGCVVDGTDNIWSGALLTATCQTQGDQFTNADLQSEGITRNPGAVTSTLWYFVEMPGGQKGYVPEVYIIAADRGGMGLPQCPTPPTSP